MQFDFGPTGSPVAPGYIGVATQVYSSAVGYGWETSSGLTAVSDPWPNSNPVISDYDTAVSNTFYVDLPNGTYTVVPTLGGKTNGQSTISIWLNKTHVAANLGTVPGQFISPAYQVQVTDQQLVASLMYQGSGSGLFDLDALSIVPAEVSSVTAKAGPAITTDVGSSASFSQAAATGTAPLTYSWYFGDGTSATGTLNPTHVYSAAGSYTAILTVQDGNNLVAGSPVGVTINPPPTASAGPNQAVNEETATSFVGSVTGGTSPYTDSWNFGDGAAATGTLTPTHVYATPGTYTATLSVTDAAGLSSQSSLVVTVTDVPPTVNIGGPYQGKAQAPVSFAASATSVNPVEQKSLVYAWNFGDSSTATGPSPSHTFVADGIYNVSLTVTDSYGGSTKATTVVDIFPSVNITPIAAVNAMATASLHGSAIGSSSFTYAWTFGDGTTASGSLTPTHVYQNPGSYTATLTATDGNNLSSTASAVVTVNDVAPTVSLSAPSSADTAQAASFAATGTDISPAVQAAGFSYSWNFGDGTIGTGASLSHTFASAGTYTVVVTATDEYGKTGTASSKITISVPPTISAGSPLVTNAGSSMAFSQATESAGAAPLSYLWTFGDGTNQSGSLNPSHTYANPGNYTATVKVTDANNVSASSSVAVTVNDVAPSVSLSAPLSGTAGVAVGFSASATDISPAVQAARFTYSWNFGDGSTGTGANTSHTFASAGTYTINVTAADEYGKTGTATSTIAISALSSTPQSFHFDFGPAGQAVASGYTPVSAATIYSQSQGYGWQNNTRLYDDSEWWANCDPLLRDYCYGADDAFLLDLPSGVYNVTPTMGDYLYPRDQISIWINGQQVASNLSSAAGVWLKPTYQVPITSGQLQLRLVDSGGVNPYWDINGLDVTYVSPWNGPTANAGPSQTVNEGVAASFANATASGGTAPLSYLWNFGDGTTKSGALNPTHVYANRGIYTATLTVTDANNLASTSSTAVTVNDVAPTVTISVPSSGVIGSAISFLASATSPSPIDQAAGFTYNLNFGDGSTGTGANPSHTYNASGTYTVSATATDQDGATSVQALATILITATIPIDAGWLQQRGPGPYYLDQAGATYVLQSDVTVNGTAFIVLNKNITFDLNGHTITYGNSPPITVTNGGIETGDLTGWNVSAAPGATVQPAITGMWGNYMLQLPNVSSTETIVSSPITIPVANLEYEAAITPKGNSDTTVAISVIDTVTGAVLATGTSSNPARGFSAITSFTPATTDPVALRIAVTPASGKTDTVDLDYAAVTRSRDYGIVATPSYYALPQQLQTGTVTSEASQVGNFTVKNGSITQGAGRSYAGSPIFAQALTGAVINGVTMYASGMDTCQIFGQYITNLTVTNCNIQAGLDRISNRMLLIGAISMQRSAGTIDIENNEISGTTGCGIQITGASYTALNYQSIKILNNTVDHTAIVTDGYGIWIGFATNNYTVAYNTVHPVYGRGIMVDGGGGQGSAILNGTIHDNDVIVQERPYLETGYNGIEVPALRIRPYTCVLKNLDIYNNSFVAYTGIGTSWGAFGGRISLQNDSGQSTNCNLVIQGNTFKAIVTAFDPSYTGAYTNHAWAFGLSGVDPGTGLIVQNNQFISNCTSLNLGDNDSYGLTNAGVLFLGNTIVKSTAGVAMTYTSIAAGDWNNIVTNIQLVDTQYQNGATSTVTFLGNQAKDVEFGWLLNVSVTDATGNPVNRASVTIQNQDGTQVYSGTTNAQGAISAIPLVATTFFVAQGGNDNNPTQTAKNSFTIQAASGTKSASQTINLTADATVNLVLS
jgi:PKD repeat protein